jgi:hypothetical protein
LLANSILPLAVSMLGLLLLTIKPMPPGIWRWCSGTLLMTTVFFVTAATKAFRRLNLPDAKRDRVTRFVFFLFGVFGTATMLLQLCNIALLGAFWPFFAGIVYQLITAMAQFARMILLLPE